MGEKRAYTVVPDFKLVVVAESEADAQAKGVDAFEREYGTSRVMMMVDGEPQDLLRRYRIDLVLEVDAEDIGKAIEIANDVCDDVTIGSSAGYWDDKGVETLTLNGKAIAREIGLVRTDGSYRELVEEVE